MKLLKPTAIKRVLFFVFVDIILSIFTIILAFLIRFKFHIPSDFYNSVFTTFLILIPLKIVILAVFRQYSITWKFYSFVDAKNLLKAHIVIYAIFGVIIFLGFHYFYIPKSIAIIDFFASFVMLGSLRFFKRLLIENNRNEKQVIFIGANTKTQNLIKRCLNGELDFYPIAIYDEVESESYISNVKVLNIDKLDKNVDSAIITKQLSPQALDNLVKKLTNLGINDIKIATDFENKLKNISIEDLLARKPKDIDTKEIEKFIKNKIVLVTGAGGSIGSEIVRLCDKFGAKQIIMVDKCEYNLYQISNEVNGVEILCSVNSPLLENTFKEYKPEIVIHTAAYKHVPICEENPMSCIYNNVFGSIRVIDLAIKYQVQKLVNISTDKAVRPTNVMGASKRVVELYAKNVPSKNTEIVSVRFGNVLGSSGSVVPFFKKLIEENKNLLVTHPEITRYFMLIPEACSLVLQAGAIAKGGELFILDMGKPIKIKNLAEKMIKLSGKNLKIEYIGLRKGEKLYEELLISDNDLKTQYESILIVNEQKKDFEFLQNKLKKLKKDWKIIKEIVPEYKGMK